MKDYISEARKYNVRIYDNDYLRKYKIHKEAKYAELFYMGGGYGIKNLEEVNEESLIKQQREDLREIENQVKQKTDFDVKAGFIVSSLYFGTGAVLSAIGRSNVVAIWILWGSNFLYKALRPMRLRKDIAMTGWIIDNKEKVDRVLREEVDSKRKPIENTNTLNAIIPKYPTDLVPYSQSMYEEGINLNNIDELSYKTLKKLKRTVIRRERRNKND